MKKADGGYSKLINSRIYNENFKGYYTSLAAAGISAPRKKPESTDTLIRREIYSIIKEGIEKGKTKVEILTELMNLFPDYPGAKHFGTQIDDQIKKFEKEQKRHPKQGANSNEERD